MKSQHPIPAITPVNQYQVERARAGELVLQKCAVDGTLIHQPTTNCPSCLGIDLTWQVASGRATLFSWVRIHQPYLAAFTDEIPYLVAYVKLEEGPFLMTTLVDADPATLTIDHPLIVDFEAYGESGMPLPVFRLVA